MLRFKFRCSLQFFILVFSTTIVSQLRPPIKNFTAANYNGENQNWDISQASSKQIYIANSEGLLEFNGAIWSLYPSPNESIMRSVKFVDGRIYSGCYMEFGYWVKDTFGKLNYTSISKNIGVPLVEDEEFWNILELNDLILFQSKKRIYIYDINDDSVKTIESNGTITNIIKVNETIYFQRIGEGIFKIAHGESALVTADSIIKEDEVINIFQNGDNLLILTKNNGFYDLKNDAIVQSDISSNGLLSTLSLYDAIKSERGEFILGTISNGIIYLNENGEFLNQINQNNGLVNNTVLSIYEDVEYNIWLGLDNGLSYINTKSPYRVFNDDNGVLGSVYTAALQDGVLYLGTNQGLFYRDLESFEDFRFVKGTKGQVWNLKKIGDVLFCAHHSGTFIVNNGTVKQIANIPGTWNLTVIEENPELILQGNYDGLYMLEKFGDSWRLKNKIEGFNNSSRYFETIGNILFVNHEYNGVFKLEVDNLFQRVIDFSEDNAIRGANSGMTKYKGEILYAYKKGIYRYLDTSGKFTKDSLFSKMYSEQDYESGKLIFDNENNILWTFTKSGIKFLEYEDLTNTPKIGSIPLSKEIRNDVLGYENILRLATDLYLTGTASGYIITDLNNIENKEIKVYIEYVRTQSKIGSYELINREVIGDFSRNQKNVEISFYTPDYNKFLSTKYQYKLEGIYDSWSEWSENHTISFENLPHGDYTFRVRSMIGETVSSNIASYTFKIAKPWYSSNLMIVLYIIGFLIFSLVMHNIYKRYYKKQRQKLIEKNQKELDFAQVQNEKEIIRFKNQKLEAEFKSKSKELAASTMSIIKKNELLTNIKNALAPIKDRTAINPVIEIIDDSLNQSDDWNLFQEAFNNADSKFLKKIKKKHPKLSPNDLKLCAYLRLNLSSKEIAQLLNISPRSVEIKRYRLRKKLELQHEDNLVNYILGL